LSSANAQQGSASDGAVANKNAKLNASANPMVLMTPQINGQWQAKLLNPVKDYGMINKIKGQKGGIVSPGRSSKRSAATADQDSLEKAAKLKARQNLEHTSGKGKDPQNISFVFRDDTFLFNSSKSLGILLGDNEFDMHNSLENLRQIERQRLHDSKLLMESNRLVADVASMVSSNEEGIDLEALNFICSEIAEGLGDGGCDPKCLQTPISQNKGSKKAHVPGIRKSPIKRIQDEWNFLELQWVRR
jgi:hypothetical protein